MNIGELCAYYIKIQGDSDEFALDFSKIVGKMTPDVYESYLDIIKGKSTEIKTCKNEEKKYKAKFIAFLLCCNYCRRNKNFKDFRALIDQYESLFKKEDFFKVQKAISIKYTYTNNKDLEIALALWKEIPERIKRMPAYTQAYTDTVAIYYENVRNEDEADIKLINDAKQFQELAIKARDYAKYYYTLARLQRLIHDYEKASYNVREAIDKEDSSEKDYALRIAEYQVLESKIEMDKLFYQKMNELNSLNEKVIQLKESIDKAKEDVDKAKVDNLAFLGFFTGIISFILGTFHIGDGLNYTEKTHLMFILLGCLMSSFAVFRLLVEKIKVVNLLLTIGVIIISFAFMYIGIQYF